MNNILTVSQINFYLKAVISENENFSDIFISGEISNLKSHYKSGHIYFSLKDEKSIIRCVMFSDYASRVRFVPEDGLKVLVRASLGVYEATGQYQLYVYDMQPYGLGSAVLEIEQLKSKLEKLGFFDEENKKPLPLYPEKIGVITADKSAALNDILNVIERRFPIAKILLYPVLVQGENAPKELEKAVRYFNKTQSVQLIIISRGGGSNEDLSAFNAEGLAFAIHDLSIPIVSGVGHQTDFTICDFVSDLRVPTPSVAGEMAVPDKADLIFKLDSLKNKMSTILLAKIKQDHSRLQSNVDRLCLLSPNNKIKEEKARLTYLSDRLSLLEKEIIKDRKNRLELLSVRLKSLNPSLPLKNGYAMVFDDKEKIIKSVSDIQKGQSLKIKLHDGYINCVVSTEGRE